MTSPAVLDESTIASGTVQAISAQKLCKIEHFMHSKKLHDVTCPQKTSATVTRFSSAGLATSNKNLFPFRKSRSHVRLQHKREKLCLCKRLFWARSWFFEAAIPEGRSFTCTVADASVRGDPSELENTLAARTQNQQEGVKTSRPCTTEGLLRPRWAQLYKHIFAFCVCQAFLIEGPQCWATYSQHHHIIDAAAALRSP